MTTAVRPLPEHGTLSRAKYHKCHCEECRSASAAYQRTRYRKRGYGTWQPLVDAEPVRQHLAMLREHGISYIRAAELAGLYVPTVGRLIYTVSGRKPVKRVRPETAAALLAVQPTAVEPFTVDATGTRRRLQALAACGWSFRTLGPRCGLSPSTPSRLMSQSTLQADTARAIADTYEQIKHLRPEDHGVTPGAAVKTRNRAASAGWRDPLWWDDMGRIDDPTFDPDAAERPLSRNELGELRRAEILHLAAFGYEPEQIRDRLDGEVSVSHIRNVINEHRAGQRRDRGPKQAAA